MTGSDVETAGQGGLLAARVAARAETSQEDVEAVFTRHGLPLIYPPARPRPIRVHRLRVVGTRVGVAPEGPIEHTFHFGDGVTALVSSNLKGKTGVLALITWCLRGTPRALQADVRRWLSRVELDATIAGQPMGFRLSLNPDSMISGLVLTAPNVAQLTDADGFTGRGGASILIEASDEEDFAAQVAGLMLDRLDLLPLVNKVTRDKGLGTQTHGWPAYYSAVYIPSGRGQPLLGDQKMAGLPGRLLQVFLDLPAAAVLTRVKATREILQSEVNQLLDNARRAVADRAAEHARVRKALTAAREILGRLDEEGDGPTLTDLAGTAATLARQVADAQDNWDETHRSYSTARRMRQMDEKALNDIQESEIARLFFHGLDPSACPRCETPITNARRQAERDVHCCAVCTTEVAGKATEDEDTKAEAAARLEASKSAEDAALEFLETAEVRLSQLTTALEAAQEDLRTAATAEASRNRAAAEVEVARWEGALAVLPKLPDTATGQESVALRVLKAADKVLEEESKAAATQLFADLNAEIVSLGRQFGISALEEVEINRAAHLKIFKGGGAQSPFDGQSPGEQLRLRIAVVVALLRVGARHGISTHPGLVLIDSPKAEEIQDFDAAVVFQELDKLAREENLQVIITTADFHLARTALPTGSVIAAEEGAPLW